MNICTWEDLFNADSALFDYLTEELHRVITGAIVNGTPGAVTHKVQVKPTKIPNVVKLQMQISVQTPPRRYETDPRRYVGRSLIPALPEDDDGQDTETGGSAGEIAMFDSKTGEILEAG